MAAEATPESGREPRALVQVEHLSVMFGGLKALDDVSVSVAEGERLAVLGPNGAGKTTLFNVVAGDVTPTRGRVVIDGVDCSFLPSRRRPAMGVARTYQRTRLFGGLSIEDNLYIAQLGSSAKRYSLLRRSDEGELRQRARDAARRVWLDVAPERRVEELAHGQRRQLEIAMAMVVEPKVLLLDEPASGLSRGERERLTELLTNLDRGVTLMIIEHDMDVALEVADSVVVMADGELVASGTPNEIRSNPLVHEIYLGRADEHDNDHHDTDGDDTGEAP